MLSTDTFIYLWLIFSILGGVLWHMAQARYRLTPGLPVIWRVSEKERRSATSFFGKA